MIFVFIVFPFKVMLSDDERDTTFYIPRTNWKYIDFSFPNDKKNIVKQEKISDSVMNVLLQVEDTGVYVEHVFQRKQGKWWLAYLKNGSD